MYIGTVLTLKFFGNDTWDVPTTNSNIKMGYQIINSKDLCFILLNSKWVL